MQSSLSYLRWDYRISFDFNFILVLKVATDAVFIFFYFLRISPFLAVNNSG